MQAPDPLPQILADLGVERSERLVEKENARLGGERPRERDALLLPARKLCGVAPGKVSELHHGEKVPHARFNGGFGELLRALSHRQAESDVFRGRHVPEERVVLKDEPYAPVAR